VPRSVVAATSNGSAQVSWTAPAWNGGAVVTSYTATASLAAPAAPPPGRPAASPVSPTAPVHRDGDSHQLRRTRRVVDVSRGDPDRGLIGSLGGRTGASSGAPAVGGYRPGRAAAALRVRVAGCRCRRVGGPHRTADRTRPSRGRIERLVRRVLRATVTRSASERAATCRTTACCTPIPASRCPSATAW
jgi:hypothetical protein